MLRRVILSSVGAKNSASQTLSANFRREVRQHSLHLYFNCGIAGLACSLSRVCSTTGQKPHETRTQVLFQNPTKSFNPNYDLKGFVARPGKSVSTTGRDLCQDFFMVN